MRIPYRLKTVSLSTVLATLGLLTASAQTMANWIGASGGEWNTGANWDVGVPDGGTNVVIGSSFTVNYNQPMISAGFGVLTDNGVLNINTNGFNNSGIFMLNPGGTGKIFLNNGAALNVTGNLGYASNSVVSMAVGSSLTVSGSLIIGSGATGGTSGSTAGSSGIFTNLGGALNASATTLNPANGSITASCRLIILGGTNNLGAFAAQRSPGAANAPQPLGTDGLVISNGFVNTTSISIGNNAHGILFLVGGTLTNTGAFTLKNATVSRPARFLQVGGLFVNSSAAPVVMSPSGTGDTAYAVQGGTNIISGIQFGAIVTTITSVTNVDINNVTNITSTTNYTGTPGVVYFTNAATIYVGSAGISSNGSVTINALLNTGGKFISSTDWTNTAPITLNGGTFVAQDAAGTAHTIYSLGVLRGSGVLNKTGGGTMTLAGTNTYTGVTSISAGTLALAVDPSGSVGSLASSTAINVSNNATFDVSGLSGVGGFVLGSAKTIAGVGSVTGTFTAGSGANISPAGVGAQGTLTFAGGLMANSANFNLELTTDTTGTILSNDLVNVVGDLNLSGANNVVVTPVGSLGIGTYRLIKYSGNLIGSVANLTCTAGTLTNPTGEIDLVVTSVRASANLVWRGDGAANLWDTATSSNWLNGVGLDRFYTGDTTIFNDTATNFVVNLSGLMSPAATAVVTVNAVNNYTFAGTGDITGTTGLTKTNSGNLTLLTLNDYTGVTTINGGTLSVSNLANGGSSSPIGAAGNASANLVLNGGMLAYLGANVTIDRGATFQANGGTFNVASNVTLTLSGTLTGSGALIENGLGQVTLTGGNNYSGGTVINGGSLRANPAATIGTNSLTLVGGTNAATFTFAGDSQVLANPLNVVGTNNYLTMNGNDTMSAATGTGTVYLNGASGNILTLQAIDSSAFNGTFSLNTLSALRINPSSGTTLNASGATFDLGAGSGVLNNKVGGVYSLGALASSGSSVQLRGSTSSGSAATTYIIGGNNRSTTYSGMIATGAGGTGASVNIVKVGTGTLAWNGGLFTNVYTPDGFSYVTNVSYTNLILYTGSTTISNGVLALSIPANLNKSSAITLATSSGVLDASAMGSVSNQLDNDGVTVIGQTLVTNGTFEVVSAQTLSGLGTIRGSLLADSGSTLNVGLPGVTGVLTVTNSVTLNGTTTMKLNHSGSPTSDTLVAAQSFISYGGTLIVTNIGGALHAGDTFTLFSASGLMYSNTFSSIVLPNSATWDTTQLAVNGTIRVVTAAGPPAIGSTDFSQLANGSITLHGVNGTPNGPASVLSTTNLALPLAQWTTVATGSFDTGGNYSPTITVNPAAPQAYYILQAQ